MCISEEVEERCMSSVLALRCEDLLFAPYLYGSPLGAGLHIDPSQGGPKISSGQT